MEKFECCKCPKYKSGSHEELHSFGNFGNNMHKIEDNNMYCEVHFLEMDEYYNNLNNRSTIESNVKQQQAVAQQG
jgi:hypothetical protein